jgi:Flp pilus assembly pilin Flp
MSGMIIAGLKAFAGAEDGSTAIEYGLIGATFGIVLVAIMPVFAPAIKGVYQHIIDSVLNVANAWS